MGVMKAITKKTRVVFLMCCGLMLLHVEVNAQAQKNQKKMETSKEHTTLLQLKVKGMHCQAGCANGIDNMLTQQEGILKSNTSFDSSAALIQYDQRKMSADQIIDLIEERGFKVEVKKEQ